MKPTPDSALAVSPVEPAESGGRAPALERADLPLDHPGLAVLNRLGAAVQRHRIYPPLSPLCREAVSACKEALDGWAAGLGAGEGPDGTESPELRVRVSAEKMYLDVFPVPPSAATIELTRRLFRADVEELVLRANATETELARFCRRLASWEQRKRRRETLSEVLTELGVASVRVGATERLEVLDYDVVPASQLAVLHAEKERRPAEEAASFAASIHKAWVRVDTDSPLRALDMVDLAFLVEDHADLAQMLLDMAGGEGQAAGSPAALRQTVSELVHLYADLSPEIARQRFEELAQMLMELDPEARRTLSRDVLLPDLLETGKSAGLLSELPDAEILEAVRTLADLEIGGSSLVRLALRRLDLEPERMRAVTTALFGEGERVEAPEDDGDEASAGLHLDSEAVPRDLRELAAMDLAVDGETIERLERIREDLADLDADAERLRCALALIGHVRNPDRAVEILRPVPDVLSALMREDPVAAGKRIRALRDTSRAMEVAEPEVAAAIGSVLRDLLTPEVIRARVANWLETADGGAAAAEMLRSFGPPAVDAFIETLEADTERGMRRTILDFMCRHAPLFASGLEPHVKSARWTVVRNAVRVLGFAGPGYEATLASALEHSDKRVVREALLALSRVGTARAAEEIFSQLAAEGRRRQLAEDAMRRFPHAEGIRLTQRFLARPESYRDRPQVAQALVSRFFAQGAHGSEELLRPLLEFRFRFWSPALMRLGWSAAAALRRDRP